MAEIIPFPSRARDLQKPQHAQFGDHAAPVDRIMNDNGYEPIWDRTQTMINEMGNRHLFSVQNEGLPANRGVLDRIVQETYQAVSNISADLGGRDGIEQMYTSVRICFSAPVLAWTVEPFFGRKLSVPNDAKAADIEAFVRRYAKPSIHPPIHFHRR